MKMSLVMREQGIYYVFGDYYSILKHEYLEAKNFFSMNNGKLQ